MTIEMFNNALNGIHADLIEEAAHITAVPKRKPLFKIMPVAAALALCAAVGAFAASHIKLSDIGNNSNIYGGATKETDNSAGTPAIKGNAYTDDEIISLIENNKEIIALNVSAEYNKFGKEIQIFTKGYYHAVLGEVNCVDLDYLTLPVCIDSQIVANIEVFRYNDEINYTLNAGGDKWSIINDALNYSDNIAFVFGNSASEIAIAPDNTVFEITHNAISTLTAGYDILATEYNTFSYSIISDSKDCITVIAKE